MNFVAPFALAFAALSLPILLLYMLKLRRRDVLVSSTLLWQRLLRDREANAPWQRLRRNLLLLLQLLILALLTLALARPFLLAPTVVSGNLVLLLDGSASMQATDVSPSRFDAARRAALDLVAGLGPADGMTVILAGAQPRVLASATNDRTFLRRVLEDVMPTDGSADWEAAFALVAAGLVGAPDGRVVLISDGALPERLPALPGAGEVRFVRVGEGAGGDNLAIAALSTREGAAGLQAFLRVVNYGATPAESLVEFTADGVLFDARRLAIPAHASANLTLTDLPYDLRVLQAHLSTEDALPLDDTAWAIHAPSASGRVLLISEGNLFLERALGAMPNIELVRLSPAQPLPEEPYALTIYDGPVTGTLAAGSVWLVGPGAAGATGEGLAMRAGGLFTATAITRIAVDDPLLRYVDLSDVHVLQARAVEPPAGARVLVEAEGGPLLFVVERPEGRLVVQTFALRDSDLPLQIPFPILVANLTDWLMPQGGGALPALVRPGDAVALPSDPEAAEIHVVAPDAARYELAVGESQPVFADTDRVGVYQIEQVGPSGAVLQSVALAVNLFDEAESDIAPRDEVWVGQSEVTAAAREEEGRREFWPWLAAAALGVLTAEWWVYQRGTAGLGRQGDQGTRG